MKRIISAILTAVLIFGILPISVFADNIETVVSGGLTWTLDTDTMVLTVSGEGPMLQYSDSHLAGFGAVTPVNILYSQQIVKVIIEEGVTSISDYAFNYYYSLKEIVIPSTVERIGFGAFKETPKLESIVFPENLKMLDNLFDISAPCKTLIFTGDAPLLSSWFHLFTEEDEKVKIYYPEENSTWTSDAKAAFGDNVIWNDEVVSKGNVTELMTDVKENHWFVDAVQYVYDRGLMTGTAEDKFSPMANLTRAQMVQMLFNMSGENRSDYMGKSRFEDVDLLAWYTPAVNWADKNNITDGVSDTLFAPNKEITRQELARFLFVYAGYIGYYYTTPRADLRDPDDKVFNDVGEIADWAYEAMSWAVAAGVISGMSIDTISPRTTAYRCQAAYMLMMFDKYIEENKRITTGAFVTLADFIVENGKYGGGYWPDTYVYTFKVGDMYGEAEYFVSIDSITLSLCGERYEEHLFVGAHANCMEEAVVRIDGLRSEYDFGYTYFPMGENENPDIISKGMITAEGYNESEFGYGDYIPGDHFIDGYYLNNEEYTEFATQKRDTAIAAMHTFIDHLLTGCGLERQDLFITK